MKELTKRKWAYMLTEHSDEELLGSMLSYMGRSQSPNPEKLAANVADLKSLICEEIQSAHFHGYTEGHLTKEYDMLNQKRFQDTIKILYQSNGDDWFEVKETVLGLRGTITFNKYPKYISNQGLGQPSNV